MLSMGSTGAGKAAEDALNILELVTKPKEYKGKIEEIAKQLDELYKAVGGKAKLDQADSLLAEAERVKADAETYAAKNRLAIKEAKDAADVYAKDVKEGAEAKADEIRSKISAEQEKWAEKSKTLSDWEAAITGMKNDLEKKTATADNRAAEGNRLKKLYESKIEKLRQIVL